MVDNMLPHPLEKFTPYKVVDSHFHMITRIKEEHLFDNLVNVLAACKTDAVNVLALSGRGGLEENMAAALCKAMYPSRVYAFGGLHYHLPGVPAEKIDLESQARKLASFGFDGFKFIEGKPDVRKQNGLPLDHPSYEGVFIFAQEAQLPIIYHVADPWRGNEPPEEMKEVYGEIHNVLNKFPRLRITFAHFFFLAHQLDRAAELLDKYPHVNLDLTPHGGMYADFSQNPQVARQFFIQYQDRIVFGTDNHGEPRSFPMGSPMEYWPVYKHIAMRTFLETDQSFRGWHADLRGIALPGEVLDKIYHKNFQRTAGDQPKPFRSDLVVEECERLLNLARRYAIIHEVLPGIQLLMAKLKKLT